MRRNFPQPYTTTYLRLCLIGSTRNPCRVGNYLSSSGCTYGLDTVSFHSIRVEVYFDAVSAHARPVLSLQSALPYCHAPSILSLLAGFASARPSALVDGAGFEPAVVWSADILHLLPRCLCAREVAFDQLA